LSDNYTVKFVGDLSVQDAGALFYAVIECDVLEFGCGGSTQIFASQGNNVTSVETNQYWIDRTKKNLELIPNGNDKTKFIPYDYFRFDGQYDVIFVDGVPGKRLQFAEKSWKCLKPGGVMIFHDTRRFEYFREAAWVMQLYFNEIDEIDINYKDSNLTFIHKRNKPVYYENWNLAEGKPMWAYGADDHPTGEGLWETKI
jgi:SAM-dependent methyltransferase